MELQLLLEHSYQKNLEYLNLAIIIKKQELTRHLFLKIQNYFIASDYLLNLSYPYEDYDKYYLNPNYLKGVKNLEKPS